MPSMTASSQAWWARRPAPRWRALFLVLAVFASYAPAVRGEFVFDDHALVDQAETVRVPLSDLWTTARSSDYWPLSYTVLWLQWRAWGDRPLGYHVVNVALHAVNALLVWHVLALLGLPGAWLGGLLFGLHPVAVESVAWISELKNVLSGLLFLSTSAAWIRHRLHGGRRWYVLALASFLLALLAKTSTVMLPVVLLGWDVLRRRGPPRRRELAGLAPFFALSLLLGAVTLWFQWNRAMSGTSDARSIFERVFAPAWAFCAYVWTAYVPVGLAFLYPPWPVSPTSPWFALPAAALALGAVILWRYRRSAGGPILLALGYQGVMLLPVLGLVGIAFFMWSPVANHLQYLALPGPVALVAFALARPPGSRWRAFATGASVVIVLGLGATTFARAHAFADDFTLWETAERDAPGSLHAAWMHSVELKKRGRPAEANAALAALAERAGDPATRHAARCLWLLGTGRHAEALPEALASDRLRHDHILQIDVGIALLRAGRPVESLGVLAPLSRRNPSDAESRHWLRTALDGALVDRDAIRALAASCRRDPGDGWSCRTFALLAIAADRPEPARAAVAALLGLGDHDPRVTAELAALESLAR